MPSIPADTILEACAAGQTIALSRDHTLAVALQQDWNVDVGSQWTGLSVSDPSVLVDVPYSRSFSSGAANGDFKVGLYRAARPGKATISAVPHSCDIHSCDRGHRWWVTIQVT